MAPARRSMSSRHLLHSCLAFAQNPSLSTITTTSSVVRLLLPSSSSSSCAVAQPNNNKLKKSPYSIFQPSPTQFNHQFRYSSSSAYYFSNDNFFFERNSNANTTKVDWLPRERAKNLLEVLPHMRECESAGYRDKNHWWITLQLSNLYFTTEKSLYDYYVDFLASVLQSSREEAKRKIYLVFCEEPLGFGAEIDVDTVRKVQDIPGVVFCYEDCSYYPRINDPKVRLNARFVPKNQNNRVDDIFRYHNLSKRNPKWNGDYWLISVRKQCLELGDIAHYVKLLAKIVGSENKAKKKIYMAWLKDSSGFAAKINRDTAKKLKALPDVLMVLPDYSFDFKLNDWRVQIISGERNRPHYGHMYFDGDESGQESD